LKSGKTTITFLRHHGGCLLVAVVELEVANVQIQLGLRVS
jgi:hypothetical protein